MDWGWVRTRLRELDKTQEHVAGAIRRDRTIVTKMMGASGPIRTEHVRVLAEVLEVPVAEMLFRAGFLGRREADVLISMGESQQLSPEIEVVVYVPLISWVEAGALREVEDPYEPGAAEEYIAVTYKRESLIALRVRGQSMNREAPDGSVIIVDYEDRDLVLGKLYVIKTENGEATFKRYRSDPVRFEPVSTEEHETIFPTGDWFVVGRVVEIRKKT